MALVAAVGIGLALARAYQSSMESAAAAVGGAMTYPLRIRWFGRPTPLLVSLTLTLFALRLIGPRPRYRAARRLARVRRMLCGGLGPGHHRTDRRDGARDELPGHSRSPLYLHFLMMRSVTFAAPITHSELVEGAALLNRRRTRSPAYISFVHRGYPWVPAEAGGSIRGSAESKAPVDGD